MKNKASIGYRVASKGGSGVLFISCLLRVVPCLQVVDLSIHRTFLRDLGLLLREVLPSTCRCGDGASGANCYRHDLAAFWTGNLRPFLIGNCYCHRSCGGHRNLHCLDGGNFAGCRSGHLHRKNPTDGGGHDDRRDASDHDACHGSDCCYRMSFYSFHFAVP